MNRKCKELLNVLIHGTTRNSSLKELLMLAKMNKTEVSLAERMLDKGKCELSCHKILYMYEKVLEKLIWVYGILEHCDVLLIKFQRELKYVPSDFDFLVPLDKISCVIDSLRARGFTIVEHGEYSINMRRADVIVDLYIYPSMGNIVYLDQNVLFQEPTKITILNKEVLVPKKSAEIQLLILHAMFKEMKITLNDFITTVKWIREIDEENLINLAKVLIEVFVTNNSCPARVSLLNWVLLAGKLFMHEPLFRSTLPNIFSVMVKPQAFRELSKKLFWDSY